MLYFDLMKKLHFDITVNLEKYEKICVALPHHRLVQNVGWGTKINTLLHSRMLETQVVGARV